MNGAQIAIEALRREGVRLVAGLPGTTVMHPIDAVGGQPGMRYISARHEQVAAFMADGYARASGTVGVCLASRGPGAANLAIGIHNAHAESIPVLALIGQVPDQIYHREAFEEMDLVRFFEPITKWSVEIHEPSRIPELLQRAVRTALSGRPGPVMVSLPLDVQTAEAAATFQPSVRSAPPAPQASAVQEAAGLLAAARRPVIIAGGGVRGPGYDPGLIQLAERLQVPVVTSWLRKNIFPNDCVLFCGSLGYGAVPVTEDLVREADVVLAIGCRFSEFTTGRWTLLSPATTLIQVDIEADSLGRYYVPAIGICADAAEATAALAAAVDALGDDQEPAGQPGPGAAGPGHPNAGPQQSARGLRGQRAAAAHAAYRQQTSLPGPPPGAALVPSAALVAALRTVLGRTGATLVQDAPSMGVWIQRHIDFTVPGTYYAAAGGSMGWGFPAAMGMQLARPGDRIITVSGDGSFWMVAQDMETAVRENLPIVNVINNNSAFGNTRDRQRSAHGGRYLGVFYGNPDFAAFARLLGAHGERVESADGLVPALDRAFASGLPAIVDVIQDQHEGLPPGVLPPPAR
ncbi:MAG: acetolactate synthase large subunit [Streptosporangiaceae bacterium]|nr:acetolactate synthase large subunit [Streptosporangiaceae bacterium]